MREGIKCTWSSVYVWYERGGKHRTNIFTEWVGEGIKRYLVFTILYVWYVVSTSHPMTPDM